MMRRHKPAWVVFMAVGSSLRHEFSAQSSLCNAQILPCAESTVLECRPGSHAHIPAESSQLYLLGFHLVFAATPTQHCKPINLRKALRQCSFACLLSQVSQRQSIALALRIMCLLSPFRAVCLDDCDASMSLLLEQLFELAPGKQANDNCCVGSAAL